MLHNNWRVILFNVNQEHIIAPINALYLSLIAAMLHQVRDGERDKMRDKYNITKPDRTNEDEESDEEEEEDGFGPRRPAVEKDGVTKAKDAAVEKLQDATNMVSGLFSGFRK